MLSISPFTSETVGQIIKGIASSVNATEKIPNIETPLAKEDYIYEKCCDFIGTGGKKGVRVSIFAPKVFYQIRKFHGISETEFQNAWNLSEENLKTKEGAGRSGSLFCHSQDKKFIFKTIFEDEKVTLLNLLPAYFDHITRNPSSLLMRIFGLFHFPHVSSYVLVFGNLLFSTAGPPDQIFDLKGRDIKPGHENIMDGEKKVFKDKNLRRKFRFSEAMHDTLFQHLEQDVELLKKANIMDYSLLIGVRNPSTPNDIEPPTLPTSTSLPTQATPKTPGVPVASTSSPGLPSTGVETQTATTTSNPTSEATPFRSVSIFQQVDGGFKGGSKTDPEEVYHIGIIDCLTNYGKRKKIANFCKSMRWKQEALSTVDATFYADRFMKFMSKVIVIDGTPGANDIPVLLPPPAPTTSINLLSIATLGLASSANTPAPSITSTTTPTGTQSAPSATTPAATRS
eukprot:TRINITY_DN827_c0_g1_i2.p1 TRINITY_DN827_c0_g1~~TRINITY_DN827_c0_g1_i2.p1  ORF type:complete len:455 (-),score=99.70 TRINITY_DN827_c0_g1_i2:140-1504(-)